MECGGHKCPWHTNLRVHYPPALPPHFINIHTFMSQAPKELGAKMLGRNWQALLSAPPDLTGKGILSIEEWQQRAQTGVVS